jgi:hypothetical protein
MDSTTKQQSSSSRYVSCNLLLSLSFNDTTIIDIRELHLGKPRTYQSCCTLTSQIPSPSNAHRLAPREDNLLRDTDVSTVSPLKLDPRTWNRLFQESYPSSHVTRQHKTIKINTTLHCRDRIAPHPQANM